MHRILSPRWAVIAAILLLFSSTTVSAAVLPTPTGVNAIAGNGEVSLIWNAVDGAASYAVYRAGNAAGPFGFIAQTGGTGVTDRGLANGATYYYTVAAVGESGRSENTAPLAVAPTAAVLPAPGQVRAAPGNGQVSLSWSPVTSAVSYSVWRATSPGGPYTLLDLPAAGPSITDTGLTDGTTYFYVVQTMSTTPGAYSDEVATTPSPLLPAAPTNVAAGPGSTWAALTWHPSAGATGYAVYRGTTTGGPYAFAGMSRTTRFEDFNLANGTTYTYRVAAVNDAGQGALSAETAAAVAADAPPHAPVVTARKTGTGEIQLDWTAPAGAVSYSIHRSGISGGAYTDLGAQTTTGFNDTGLTNGETYFYVVDAHNASSSAARSNEVAVTPVLVLPAPANVTVIPGNTQATINWHPVVGATDYYVDVRDAPGGSYVTGGSAGGPGFTATGLTNGTTYYVTVQSVGGTVSAASGSLAFTPSAALPLYPENLSAPASGNTRASLLWSPVSGAAGYQIFRRTDGAPWPGSPVAIVSGTLYTDGGLTNNTRYYYRVAAINDAGAGAWTLAEIPAAPKDTAPPAPTGVVASPGNTEAKVMWQPVPGAGSYYITFATRPGGDYVAGGFSSDPGFTATGLTNGTPYYVRVQTVAASGSSAFSAETAVTPSVTLPLAPQNVSAPVIGNTQVSLQWSPVSGASGYVIFRSDAGAAWPDAPHAAVTGTLFTDAQVSNGARYSYRVAAVNGSGSGAWSASAVAVTPGPAVPLAPLGVAVLPGNTEATLTWHPAEGATDYYVTVSDAAGGGHVTGGFAGSQLSYKASGLVNGRPYFFRVQATAGGASAFSHELTTAPAADLPLAPTSFSAAVVGNTEVSLQWPAVSGADGYLVRRRAAGDTWDGATAFSVTGGLFTDTGLTNGATYVYAVSATAGAGSGAWAAGEVSATPTGVPPTAPANVTVVAGDGSAAVSWDAVIGAVDYYVTVSDVPGGAWTGGGSSGGAASFQATGLTNGQTYWFRLQAGDGGNWSAFSQETSAVPTLPPDHGTITGRISVSVAGHSDLGVAGATVAISGTAYTATTGDDGTFSMGNIPFGNYTLAVSAPGLDSVTVAVPLTSASYTAAIPQMTLTQTNGVQGDADGDGQVGLPDAIYILQVLTNAR